MEMHKAMDIAPLGGTKGGDCDAHAQARRFRGIYALWPGWAQAQNRFIIKLGESALLRARVLGDYTLYWPRVSGSFRIVAFMKSFDHKQRETDALDAAGAFGFVKPVPDRRQARETRPPKRRRREEYMEFMGGDEKAMRLVLLQLFKSIRGRGDGKILTFTRDAFEVHGRDSRHTDADLAAEARAANRPKVSTRAATAAGEPPATTPSTRRQTRRSTRRASRTPPGGE
jgi:hypothetical protein